MGISKRNIGFRPHPDQPPEAQALNTRDTKDAEKRIKLCGEMQSKFQKRFRKLQDGSLVPIGSEAPQHATPADQVTDVASTELPEEVADEDIVDMSQSR